MKKKQKAEAIKRMKKLGIIKDAIDQFKDDDMVMVSENGFLFWIDDDLKQMVKDFENEYEALVYMVVHSKTQFGDLYSMLYVSKHEEEWEMDNEDLTEGYVIAYVKNVTDDWCSEIGSIAVKNRFGGLVRVG